MNITGKVFSNIKQHYNNLTVTDKRIVAIISDDPEFVAFGTVAEVAARAQTSGPSVVRLAEKLGYNGFIGIQSAVRDDLSQYLSSSLSLIKQDRANNHIQHTKAIELHNVESTLSKVDETALSKFVNLVADHSRKIFILSSDQCSGAALTFRDLLALIHPDVHVLKGSEYRISSQLVKARRKDILLTMDFERHERWVVNTHETAIDKGLYAIAITNNPLCSLAVQSEIHFFASATAPGPFDSNTGLNALLNLFIAQLSEQLKDTLGKKLKEVHRQWENDHVFEDIK